MQIITCDFTFKIIQVTANDFHSITFSIRGFFIKGNFADSNNMVASLNSDLLYKLLFLRSKDNKRKLAVMQQFRHSENSFNGKKENPDLSSVQTHSLERYTR
jgi:hypothetical protein